MASINSWQARIVKFCAVISFLSLSGTVLSSEGYADLYQSVRPSVVRVSTQTFKITEYGIKASPGTGTGILIDHDLVMTASHVVEDSDLIQIKMFDDREISAKVLVAVDAYDVALLKLEESIDDAVVAKLGDSSSARIGEPVFVIGYPFGLDVSLSAGYLSGRLEKTDKEGKKLVLLQTDSAINPGNSGGPMINQNGEVVGIVSFILTKSGGYDGVGFASAIESSYVALMNSSAKLTGLETIWLSKRQAAVLNLPDPGLLVQRVIPDTMASRIGLKAGSVSGTIMGKELRLGGDFIVSMECADCAERISTKTLTRQLQRNQAMTLNIRRVGDKVKLNYTPVSGGDEAMMHAYF